MTNEIIRKLNDHIAKGLHAEADVAYLFIELGKLMEGERCESDYPTLKFYRDWVVHARIEYSRTGASVLQRVAEIVFEQKQHTDTDKMCRDMTDALSFEKTRLEANALISCFGGSANAIDDNQWRVVILSLASSAIVKFLPCFPRFSASSSGGSGALPWCLHGLEVRHCYHSLISFPPMCRGRSRWLCVSLPCQRSSGRTLTLSAEQPSQKLPRTMAPIQIPSFVGFGSG